MAVRVRIPELLEERGWTAYKLAKASADRVSLSTAYRLTKSRGTLKMFPAKLLDALCATFCIGPGELLERDKVAKRSR